MRDESTRFFTFVLDNARVWNVVRVPNEFIGEPGLFGQSVLGGNCHGTQLLEYMDRDQHDGLLRLPNHPPSRSRLV